MYSGYESGEKRKAHCIPLQKSWRSSFHSIDLLCLIHKWSANLRLINLKGKELVFGGSKNSNWTDRILIKRLF